MRRLTLLAVILSSLVFTTCRTNHSWHGNPDSFRPRDRRGSLAPACHEISRFRCDAGRCKGPNLDWVEVQCADRRTSRCELSRGCSTD